MGPPGKELVLDDERTTATLTIVAWQRAFAERARQDSNL